jgi:predicted PurR-regulated permease PerM
MHPVDRLRETRLLPVLVLLGAIAVVWFLSEVSNVLPPFLWALVTAYILFPVVRRLERALRLPRLIVVAGLYIVFIAGLISLGTYMGPVAMDQGEALLASLPETVDNARAELMKDPTLTIGAVEIDTQALNDRIDEAIQNAVGDLSTRAVPLVFHTVEIVIQILVYFLVTFYFLLHGDEILRQARSLTPRRYRATIDRVGRQVNATLGAYIRGQVILFVIMSVMTYIALTIFGVEYALALAIATGVLELVPIIGPWTAGAAAVTVAISQGHAPFGWTQVELGAAVAITYLVLRMLEDHFVIPQLIGRIVRVHPVLVIFAILAGASTFGMLGLLLAVPLLATAKIIAQSIYYELGNPPTREVIPIRTASDLLGVRRLLGGEARGHLVMLIGPDALDWEDVSTMQELAMLAVSSDVTLEVVTPDRFAASVATSAGLPVVTEARLSDEVGTAETLLSREARERTRRRFAFTEEVAGVELPSKGEPQPQSTD